MSGWAVLNTWDGMTVIRREDVRRAMVMAMPGNTFCIEVRHVMGTECVEANVWALDGESPGDALARVCGLLGIEVQR